MAQNLCQRKARKVAYSKKTALTFLVQATQQTTAYMIMQILTLLIPNSTTKLLLNTPTSLILNHPLSF